MIRAFIVKHLEQIKSIPRLIVFLDDHPVLTEMCGFKMGSLPDETQVYRFLKETPNSFLQGIHMGVNREIIKKGCLRFDTFLIDSKFFMVATLEKLSVLFIYNYFQKTNSFILIQHEAEDEYGIRRLYARFIRSKVNMSL